MVEIQTLLNKRDGKNHFCTEPDCKPCGVAACGGKADATKAKLEAYGLSAVTKAGSLQKRKGWFD
jgi:hypothetical protein